MTRPTPRPSAYHCLVCGVRVPSRRPWCVEHSLYAQRLMQDPRSRQRQHGTYRRRQA